MNDLQLISYFFFQVLNQVINLYTVSFILAFPIVLFLLDNLVSLFKKIQGKR